MCVFLVKDVLDFYFPASYICLLHLLACIMMHHSASVHAICARAGVGKETDVLIGIKRVVNCPPIALFGPAPERKRERENERDRDRDRDRESACGWVGE